MKIAITGKGGVGKTTITAGLARSFANMKYRVIALDMDPSPNLVSSLGCTVDVDSIKPLMEMSDLIEERTGTLTEGYGLVFKINPKVDDILEKYGVKCKGVKMLILGGIRRGGGGCFCPANALAKRLIDHLTRNVDILIMDMEAGVEHLGRGTTRTVEVLLIIVEPSLRSVETARHINKLASDLGIKKIFSVLNKTKSIEEERKISNLLKNMGIPMIYSIPYIDAITKSDLSGISIFNRDEGEYLLKKLGELGKILYNEARQNSP